MLRVFLYLSVAIWMAGQSVDAQDRSQAHAQFIADLADFKMNIQAALEAPRFSKHTFSGCDVMMENRFSQAVRNELTNKGHKIDWKGTFSSDVGGGQAVLRDFAAGVNYGASDPRKDGQAVAELPLELNLACGRDAARASGSC